MLGWIRKLFTPRQAIVYHTGEVQADGSVAETFILPWSEFTRQTLHSEHPIRAGYFLHAWTAAIHGPREDNMAKVETTYWKHP